MAKELKTLEDCRNKGSHQTNMNLEYDFVREEAIKHAKKLNDGAMLCIKYGDNEGAKMCLSQLKWVEEFFNISDEEIR